MSDCPTATGRIRFRSQRRWGRREEVVLQVEIEGWVPECIGGHIDVERRRWWKDARTEDLLFLKLPVSP